MAAYGGAMLRSEVCNVALRGADHSSGSIKSKRELRLCIRKYIIIGLPWRIAGGVGGSCIFSAVHASV
jgi:hypothetical protein